MYGSIEQGYVKHVVFDRGFFFVATSDGTDVFCHVRDLDPELWNDQLQGMRVEFTVERTEKGHRGRNVRAAH